MALAKTTAKNGAVLISTAALPAPASFVATAIPSNVSETTSGPEMAPSMSMGRSLGRRAPLTATASRSASVAGRARNAENTVGEACPAPMAVARNAVPQKNIVVARRAAEPAPMASGRLTGRRVSSATISSIAYKHQ